MELDIDNVVIDGIASVTYNINKAWAEYNGDFSFSEWKDAPEWQKDTNRKGVIFHLTNPGASPSASHESWYNEKLKDGWTYGPIKNVTLKEHPCMVPYDELPKEQQFKDTLFITVVRSSLEAIHAIDKSIHL